MGGLPDPPSFRELTGWAGTGRVLRADAAEVGGWQLPQPQKSAFWSARG